MLGNKKGQSVLEYGLIIAVVVAALLAINTYMKKGMQGKLKESTDQIGRQFEPATFSTAWKTASSGKTTTTEKRNAEAGAEVSGDTTSDIATAETITRSEHESWGTSPAQHFTDGAAPAPEPPAQD